MPMLNINEIPAGILTEQGDVIYASGEATPAALAHGTAGQVLQSGGHGANPSWIGIPRCEVYRNAALNINSESVTRVNLDTEVYDLYNEFDSSTNYRFVASVAGYYLFIGVVAYTAPTADKSYAALLFLNGVTEVADFNAVPSAVYAVSLISSGILYLAANEYAELWTWHNAGAAKALSVGRNRTYLYVGKVG